jgi:hypothetical protein
LKLADWWRRNRRLRARSAAPGDRGIIILWSVATARHGKSPPLLTGLLTLLAGSPSLVARTGLPRDRSCKPGAAEAVEREHRAVLDGRACTQEVHRIVREASPQESLQALHRNPHCAELSRSTRNSRRIASWLVVTEQRLHTGDYS